MAEPTWQELLWRKAIRAAYETPSGPAARRIRAESDPGGCKTSVDELLSGSGHFIEQLSRALEEPDHARRVVTLEAMGFRHGFSLRDT